jgi:hypothetical protein
MIAGRLCLMHHLATARQFSRSGEHAMTAAITRIIVSALALVASPCQAAETARVLLVVGPSDHPPGTHKAGGGKTSPPGLAAFTPESPTPQPSPKKAQPAAAIASRATADISRVELLDRIHGGWAGMLIGGLEGLPHEFKYKEQPRDTLPEFTLLEKGARADDDNDFEWPHLFFMDQEGTLKLPYPRLVEIWKANMNSGIWVANKKARDLMDQGVVPPETGSVARNPHAWYNLSGQFCVESYGLIAPGMPQTAADIGLHYTRIAVSEEPLQAAPFWSSLIALRAFHQGPMDDALQQATAAVDPKSAMAEVVADARKAFQAHPGDWKAARQEIDAKWRVQRQWNDNSTPVNGAAVCLALLYGRDDFYQTLQYAMALGYDADCNAATAGAIVGVRLGFQRIAALPQFKMPDRYVNKTRPQLPAESKVSEQAETLLRVAERVILANGGETITIASQPGYRVKLQQPRLIEPLPEKVHGPENKP